MKKILLLGGSAQQVIAIETAKRLGYYTVLCDFLIDNPGQHHADKFYLISTTDRKAVLEVAQNEQIDGILAYASDPAAPTAAYVAEKMDIPGNPYDSVDILCNKNRFRKFLAENGFSTPAAYGFENREDALKKTFSFPIIVKPVDSSGSKGITVLHSSNGLAKAIGFAFSYSRCHRIIIEDYIEKKHPYLIGGDIFVSEGEIVLWGLLNCHRDNTVNPLVPIGKSYPLQLEIDDEERVKDVLRTMVKKLNIRNGSINVELIIDKSGHVWLIDVGPRAGGNMIPDLLSDMLGIDIVDMSIRAAMGEAVSFRIQRPKSCYATHNLHSNKAGIYKNIILDAELSPYVYKKCFYKQPGDEVQFFDNASKCLGIIFFKFPGRDIMYDILNRINDLIHVELR